MTIDSNILDRISALFALAENNNNPHESASAAAMAQSMLTQHRLSRADLAQNSPEKSEKPEIAAGALFVGKRISDWKKDLASAVCVANGVKLYYQRARADNKSYLRKEYLQSIIMVGMPSDIEIVRYFYDYLTNEIERLTKIAMVNKKISGKRGGNGFKIGAGSTVGYRLWEAYQDTRKEVQDAAKSTCTALVALDSAQEKVNEFYSTIKLGKGKARPVKSVNMSALSLGKQAGKTISLNKGMGTGTATKALN